MTVERKTQTGDSYNRCIAELRARYSGRGVSCNYKQANAALAKKEKEAKATATENTTQESFVLFNTGNKIGDQYRSGEYRGSKYMTSDDFVRYFKSRRAFFMPSALKAQEEKAEEATQNSAVPQKRGARGGLTRSDSGKEGHIKGLLSAAVEFLKKWFPLEPREGRGEATSFRFPVGAVSGVAVFFVSLMLIVGGSAMVGNVSGEVGDLNRQIAVLEADKAELQGKLDLKYNINEIEEDAKALGMIKREYADNKYIDDVNTLEIEVYDENEDKDLNLAALLSSFLGSID
jgi:hypothetical protein